MRHLNKAYLKGLLAILRKRYFIKFIEKEDDPETVEISESIVRLFKGKISLNPSVLMSAGCRVVALRVYDEHKEVIESMLIVTRNGEDVIINLSDYCKQFGVSYVADPKLFVYNDEFFITFNNGYVKSGNDIYILRVLPEIGLPTKCIFNDRELIEKNWAFYQFRDELFCVYSISPLVCLKMENKVDGVSACFTKVNCDYKGLSLINYSIGTQPFKINNVLYMVVHKKITFIKKRLYLGRICKIYLNKDGNLSEFQWVGGFLSHSVKSLFGVAKKFNKNLLSCTYFSGLYIDENRKAFLSYGVNDLKAEIKKVSLND